MSILEQQHHNEIHRMHKQNNKHDHEYVKIINKTINIDMNLNHENEHEP